jgi:nucleoside-diphosphate-sugar epimerase
MMLSGRKAGRFKLPLLLAVLVCCAGCGQPAETPPAEDTATPAATLPTIALIGATSRSGREIIRQGLAQGYRIKGLARTPAKLGVQHENLELFQGDVRDQASLEAVLSGTEVVVCMVGYPTPSDPMADIGPVDIYTVMARNLIAAMQKQGNRRLIMASSTGVETRVPLDAERPPPDDLTAGWRWNARYLYNDMHEMEQMIAATGLNYILLRPGFLVQAPARNDLKLSLDGNTPPARVVTYPDFAAFILANLVADDYLNQAVGLYSDTVLDPRAELDKFLNEQRAN